MRDLYSIKDQLVGFGLPFMAVNDSDAARTFQFALQQTPELYFKAKDLDLFKIGQLDEDTGALIACEPYLVYRGASFKLLSPALSKEAESEVV